MDERQKLVIKLGIFEKFMLLLLVLILGTWVFFGVIPDIPQVEKEVTQVAEFILPKVVKVEIVAHRIPGYHPLPVRLTSKPE